METKINRPFFINWLAEWQDKDVIKVITGIRRCGKTTLFDLFRDYLLDNGIATDQIITINFENPEYGSFATYLDAWKFIREKMSQGKRNYVFLDEIQLVPDFERVVDGLFAQKDCDIYITGSNAKFLSGDLATLLTGRYVEIKMQPLSFLEYRSVFPKQHAFDCLNDYMRFGGFPFAVNLSKGSRQMSDYLSGVLNTIIYKDVAARKGFRDTAMLERLTRFIFDNIGNMLSVNRIVGTFKSDGISVPHATLDTFLAALCETFLILKAPRYDIKGRELLKTNAKYYLADTGLRRILLGDRHEDYGHIFENVIYLELLRRYEKVFVGILPNGEIDFVAMKNATPAYFQVALTVRNEATLARELAPLVAIRDQYPKFLITLDNDPPFDHNGIHQMSAVDFMLNSESIQRIFG